MYFEITEGSDAKEKAQQNKITKESTQKPLKLML